MIDHALKIVQLKVLYSRLSSNSSIRSHRYHLHRVHRVLDYNHSPLSNHSRIDTRDYRTNYFTGTVATTTID
jgi:hypothetical protein